MIVPPTPFFSTHRKISGDWTALSGEFHSIVATNRLSLVGKDDLSKLPEDCCLSGNRVSLDDFSGYRLISIWPSHSLHDVAERRLAFEVIDHVAGNVIHAFVIDRRRLECH